MNTTLTETSVPPAQPAPKLPRPAPGIVRLFADHSWAARLWFVVAIVAIAAALIQPFLLISAYRTQERVVILDEAGTFHVSPLLNFEGAGKLQVSQALLACIALFQRNPNGFDHPELLEKMFLSEALEQAKAIQSRELPEFKAKQIHQKVEVFKVDVLQTRNDLVLVEVVGQLIRVGLFNGQPFVESPRFIAHLTLARNPNLTANGRYPLAVWKFDAR